MAFICILCFCQPNRHSQLWRTSAQQKFASYSTRFGWAGLSRWRSRFERTTKYQSEQYKLYLLFKKLRCLVEVGARDVQGLPLLAKPAPRQSYSFMAGKPVPSNLKPPGHAKGTSELTTKLGEKGLMAGRSLSPILQSRGHSLFFKRNK